MTEAISAATSVFSVIVAAVAAFFAYRAYRKQAGQLELALKHDRTWQAAKVTAWINDIAEIDSLHDLLIPARGNNTHAFEYINASDLPVYNVKLVYTSAQNRSVCVREVSRLMPTESTGTRLAQLENPIPGERTTRKSVT